MFSVWHKENMNTWRQLEAKKPSNCVLVMLACLGRVQSSILEKVTQASRKVTGPQRQEGGTVVNNNC